jgi:hypothetical protein
LWNITTVEAKASVIAGNSAGVTLSILSKTPSVRCFTGTGRLKSLGQCYNGRVVFKTTGSLQ